MDTREHESFAALHATEETNSFRVAGGASDYLHPPEMRSDDVDYDKVHVDYDKVHQDGYFRTANLRSLNLQRTER